MMMSTSLPADVELQAMSSDTKESRINDVVIDGSKVTVKFVNFAAPKQPEGGFELILDGKRTYTNITKRIYSDQKYVSMTFYLDNPKSRCYGIYARWNTGYTRSDNFCPGQVSTSSSIGSIQGLPALKMIRKYEFEDNIGRNVSKDRDGLALHHLGRTDGKVVSVDGVGAHRFKITPDGGQYSHRHELVPRDLPSPYFEKGWIPKWNQEYVYEMRVKLSNNYDIGNEHVCFMEMKNDYNTSRRGSLTLHTEGDHYLFKQYYATYYTTSKYGTGHKDFYYDGKGNKLIPDVHFNKYTKIGSGYQGVETDKGKWITWTVHVKWSYGSSGFVKIYKNGNLFHSNSGPTSFKDGDAPYVKFGLYNSYWKYKDTGSNVQESFVDYFRVYVPK